MKAPLFRTFQYMTLLIAISLIAVSCELVNSENDLIYHSYASMGVSADTVKAGSSVDIKITIWNFGNELFNLKEDIRDHEISFQALLLGEEPDYNSIWCPVGTGNISLNRSYELSEPGSVTFSVLQPDGETQDHIVVVQ